MNITLTTSDGRTMQFDNGATLKQIIDAIPHSTAAAELARLKDAAQVLLQERRREPMVSSSMYAWGHLEEVVRRL